MRQPITPLNKTLIFTALFACVSAYLAYLLQIQADKQNITPCSYLEPVFVDVSAFFVAMFLVIEGLIAIFKNKDTRVKSQMNRCIRVCIGVSIIVIHIIQFIHK